MKMKKNVLSASIAAAVIMSAPMAANAAWTTKIANVKEVVAQGASTLKDDQAAATAIVYTLAAGESLTANDTITITLSGGLTFDGTTGVTLTPSSGDVGAGAAAASAPLSGGAAGSTTATWRVIANVPTGSTLTLNTAGTIFDTNGVTAGQNANISVTLATSTGLTIGPGTQAVKSLPGDAYPFTGINLVTPTVTAVTDTAAVTTNYTRFTSTLLTGSSSTVLLTGNTSAANSIPNAGLGANLALICLEGDFAGVTQVAGNNVSASSNTGVLNAIVGVGKFAINTAKTEACAVNTNAVATANNLNANGIVFTLDGTTSQPARQFTSRVQYLGDANYPAYVIQAATPIQTILRNGTFFSTNSTGPLNNVKITDQSGALPVAGGAISVTAYDASGAVVAAAAGAPALPAVVMNNSTVVVPGTDLVANYPGAVRFDFTVNSADAVVSNVKKTADGTNLTIYRSGNGGGV